MASDSKTIAGTKGKAVANCDPEDDVAPPAATASRPPGLQSVTEEVETCAERTQPLSGKPYFCCVVCKSHVRPPFQVVVPKSLAPFLPPTTAPAVLTRRGRSWDMRFTGGRQIQRLEAGWRGFARDNGLRQGDGCVFELLDAGVGEGGGGVVRFSVQVLRAHIPSAIRERAGGDTSSSPIEID